MLWHRQGVVRLKDGHVATPEFRAKLLWSFLSSILLLLPPGCNRTPRVVAEAGEDFACLLFSRSVENLTSSRANLDEEMECALLFLNLIDLRSCTTGPGGELVYSFSVCPDLETRMEVFPSELSSAGEPLRRFKLYVRGGVLQGDDHGMSDRDDGLGGPVDLTFAWYLSYNGLYSCTIIAQTKFSPTPSAVEVVRSGTPLPLGGTLFVGGDKVEFRAVQVAVGEGLDSQPLLMRMGFPLPLQVKGLDNSLMQDSWNFLQAIQAGGSWGTTAIGTQSRGDK